MRGVPKKTNKKATITLEIPEESLDPMREDFGAEKINNLLGDNNKKPYRIKMDKFFLKQINRNPKDKYQIIETNEFPILFTFGKGAELHSYQISILNGAKENFLGEDTAWLDDYEDFFDITRAHSIVDYNLNFNLSYGDRSFDGIWFDMSFNESAELDKITGASFKFFVTRKYKKPKVGE